MRSLGRSLLAALVMLPLLGASYHLWHAMEWNDLANLLDARIEGALPSTAYRAVANQWLEFPLGATTNELKIRSTGVASAGLAAGPDIVWRYAFEYQLLGANGKLLRTGTYHHRTSISRYRDPSADQSRTRSFLLDPTWVPTDGRSMRVSLSEYDAPARLRIRPAARDRELKAVLFRVYARVPNSPGQIGYVWQRMGRAQKERLARGSVYGLDFLRDEEKHNLVHFKWQAVGPLGVTGEGFLSEKLYIARESAGEAIAEGVFPRGLYLDARARGMIPLPEGEWDLVLSLIGVDANQAVPAGETLSLSWYGRGLHERWRTEIPARPGDHSLRRRFAGGLLELGARHPWVVRARIYDGENSRDVTPEPLRLRGFRAGHPVSLTYDVDHVTGSATPFRIDVRALFAQDGQSPEGSAQYLLLDAGGKPLGGGELPLDMEVSRFDRLADPRLGIGVSDPVRSYFELPAEVASVRVGGSEHLLFTAYTRPADLSKETRIPEDYQAFRGDEERQPAWFLLRPRNEEQLREALRSETLELQPRPPEDDPRLLAGEHIWERYTPQGPWRGRYLMLPRADDQPAQDRIRGVLFQELAVAKTESLALIAPPGQREIHPTLVFLRNRAAPDRIRLTLDGKPFFDTQVVGGQGELRLPVLQAGTHRLRLDAPGGRWFINYTDAQRPVYLRRMAMSLEPGGLEFLYFKQTWEQEALTAELYTASPERTRLRVSVAPADRRPNPGPRLDWTFRERLFDLRPDPNLRVPVLSTATQTVYGGQRFFLPLGADLPPGEYPIKIDAIGQGAAYIVVYRLLPGQPVVRRFLREVSYAN